ncbi:HD domain-containing protein [Methanococcus aeolicus]|uniref:HD domain-containing protein n=1 Tax=Methanococcus aeolicus TaxID=42879 RepID=UPI0021CA91BC|nr:HD domain-containing protein [Methanococcus aeolicus]UXM84504.1 HD domain-containing protein [Methanococcus aeolicus]
MSKNKIIRDPIYKDVLINSGEIDIIDSPEVQRLRNIKQTGLTCIVYPSANHTRFEHSIGTMYIAGEIFKRFKDIDTQLIRIAGLLHDIGHPPFSHTLEVNGYDHEYHTKKKIKKMNFENYTSNEIINVLSSKSIEGMLLSGDIDADRIDYLMRDSYHTGVAYGSIDYNRLIGSMILYGDKNNSNDHHNKLAILEKGKIAVESLLIARYQMYPTVYMHPTSRISETMLKQATVEAISEKLFKMHDLSIMDDIDLISIIRNQRGEESNKLINMIDRRQLFKNIVTLKYGELLPIERWRLINLSDYNIRKLEGELLDKFDIKIFLDIPPYPKMNEHNIKIVINDKIYRLDNISPLANSLKLAYINSWDVRVYASPEINGTINKITDKDIEEINKYIFEFIENKTKHGELYHIIEENEKIRGKGNLINIIKEKGLSEKDVIEELQKLTFCGLINETVEKIGGIYRYDYSINNNLKN